MPTTGPMVAVATGGDADESACALAEDVGRELGRRGAVLLCGGLGGGMEAACRGAKETGGMTIGILPTDRRDDANPYVDIALPTGLGETRNALVVGAADVLIAVAGEYGTLSEIALALRTGTPVVGLATWELSRRGEPVDAFPRVETASDAVELALALAVEVTRGRGR